MYLRLAMIAVAALCVSSGKVPQHHIDLDTHLDNADLNDPTHVDALFTAWLAKHGAEFKDDQERMKAYAAVAENARMIKQHRGEHKEGKHTYTLGLNHLSHLTFDEFKTRLGHIKREKRGETMQRKKRAAPPASIDYSTMGYTTPPVDQGSCGCCWTFAAAEALEGAYFKKSGKLLTISKQQFVECVPGFQGCGGGAAAAAFDYTHSTGGVATESSYPYASQTSNFGACKASSTPMVAMSPVTVDVNSGDDAGLMSALATYGPIPTTVATAQPWMSYTSGIMQPGSACDPAGVNHAVLLVGYGTDASGQKFWKIKNSWGPTWGENGYLRLARNVANSCGVSTEAMAIVSV